MRYRRLSVLAWLVLAVWPRLGAAPNQFFVYVGTYTGPNSKGIYRFRFDASTGKAEAPSLAAEMVRPSFLALDPNGKMLYAVSEVGNDGKSMGSVEGFSIDPKTGALKPINTVSSGGGGSCHLVMDRTGRELLVANYGTGSVASFQVALDGRLSGPESLIQHTGSSVDPSRQRGPHAHAVVLSPDNRFVFVPDLGLDRIMIYRLDPAAGRLAANDPAFVKVKAGSGPRHFAFHPSGKFAYSLHEMGSMVTAFAYDAGTGGLKELQTISTLPADFHGENNSAEIEVDARGLFLYASNRGYDSIAVFAVDLKSGTLSLVENVKTEGAIPRNFKIDPTGRYLLAANQQTNNIVIFQVDEKTGRLSATGQTVHVQSPVCLQFLAAR